ncbi:hypothetical protein DFH09DRAFT_1330184 [Mycena vulgaris]|nr:hypothetical protein DFH09DRAFT_1330184 [Mycena vulgaris]
MEWDTTSLAVTNAILNIWSAPPSQNVVAILREEAERVFTEHNGEWTKAALCKLYRLDRILLESLRVSNIGGVALARRTKTDVALPHGLVVKKNNCARNFDAFRFSRLREEATDEKPHGNVDLVTTSAHFLPFLHGIHAWCVNILHYRRWNVLMFRRNPGRFFVANSVKMILAHILIDYEIQPFARRLFNVSFGDISVVESHLTPLNFAPQA